VKDAVQDVARLARVRDDELRGRESAPAARALLAAITAEPPPEHIAMIVPRRRTARRLALAACAVAAMTAGLVVGPSLLTGGTGTATSYASSAIEVTLEDGFFVARIKDPLADHAEFAKAFRAVGKNVEIVLVPVSPRLVGQRISSSGGSGVVSSDMVSNGPGFVDCALAPARCTLVIRISANSTGVTRYTVGRAARPGEAYQDPITPR
jgi:hypothetical protein